MTRIIALAAALCLVARAALALTCPSVPFTFTNGTTADATQVNSNFTSLLNCANTSLAPLISPSFSGTITLPDTSNWTANGLSTLSLRGATSGHITLTTSSVASGTITIPTGTDTIVTLTAAQTLTNKTISGPAIASATITSSTLDSSPIGSVSASTGAFSTVTATTYNNIGFTTGAGQTMTFPTSSDTVATLAATQTLSAKTLNAPAYSGLGTGAGTGYICLNTGPPVVFQTSASACNPSDPRLKTDWDKAPSCEVIKKMHPGTFDWLDAKEAEKGRQVGLNAQEIQRLVPGVVSAGDDITITLANGEKRIIEKPLALDYAKLTVPLIACMQEMMARR